MGNSKTRGATKVPNVKLRPAPPTSSHSVKRRMSLPRAGTHEVDTTHGEVDLNVGNKPFAGIILCATGDLDKRTLFAHAQELGATRANDFTNLVTHLVADAPGSLKYKCAVERNLPIMTTSWVEEAYQTWLNGGVVDLQQTILDHRLPIFSGVRLCLTGMEDLELRNKVHTLLAKEGGVYLKALDKTTTHLLSCSSGESPKLQWANNYNKTQVLPHKIHILWEEWFWDSLEFGGRWDEHEYQVMRPRPSRKSLAQISSVTKNDLSQNGLSSATPSQRASIPPSLPTCALLGDDPPEAGNMNKIPQARQQFYSNIFQGRDKVKGAQCTKHPDTVDGSLNHNRSESAEQHEETTRALCSRKMPPDAVEQIANLDSVLTRFASRRVTSFGSSCPPQARQPFRRIVSSASNAAMDVHESSLRNEPTSKSENESRLFMGYTFRAFGEANSPNLRSAVEERGGRWLTNEEEDTDFLVVRLVSGSMYWRAEGDEMERAKYRTECWIERCIFEERICTSDEHVVFTPLKIDTPILGSEKLYLSLSGLDIAEACWVKRLIRALGANLVPTFSRRSTHLICPSRCGAKFDKAQEWGVEIVGTEWLIEIATTGNIIDAKQYAVAFEAKNQSISSMSIQQDVKGNGKLMEFGNDEAMIVDITNGLSQDSKSPKRQSFSLPVRHSNLEQSQHLTSDNPHWNPRNSLPSQPYIPQRDLHPELNLTFGRPTGLLLSAPSAPLRKESKLDPTPLPSLIHSPPSHSLRSLSPMRVAQPNRLPTAAEAEQDKQMTLIPSSHSPSPLKIPSKPASACSPPIRETRGLRTAITALLGKRDMEDRDEMGELAQKRQGKANKRPRLPSKSKSDLESRRGPSPGLSFLSGSPPLARMLHFEDADAIPEEEQASLRVVYDDPGQRAEKKRLIALFEKEATPNVSNPGGKDDSSARYRNYDAPICVADTRPATKRKSVRRNTRSSGG